MSTNKEVLMIKSLFYLVAFLLIFYFTACKENVSEPTEKAEGTSIVILYTNDEHGWMEQGDQSNGAAVMMGTWRSKEGYSEDGNYLILSGGDNWTGPAISTWFQGESMVDVMNHMNYTAAAIGNHEFDFKIEGLKKRIEQAEFAYLSANIREKSSGQSPDYVIPYIIKNFGNFKVAIIGLTTMDTPYTTFPDHVRELDFIDYETALEEIVPKIMEQGVDLLMVIGHICQYQMQLLVSPAQKHHIRIIGGGHCNELFSQTLNDIVLIEGGSYMKSYGRIDIIYDENTNEVLKISHGTHLNDGTEADPDVANVVAYWQDKMALTLSDIIGYTVNGIERNSNEMYNMVTDSWLFTYPNADISITNIGGIRQSISAGNIDLATIVGLLPFENSILELELTGSQVISCLNYRLITGGMTTSGGYYHSDGSALVLDSVYTVLTTDYLYSRDDQNFSKFDSDPYHTGINYRQPVIDWIQSLNTTSADPLENYLNGETR
jgi:2',3'-cyclic-nucleotide 2'-phosphodiesterase (5'-nucleotidase family)